jgi:hypothetical protein
VWIAEWNGKPGVFQTSVSGWGGGYQLVHQYHGQHNETYGGKTLSIDNDCAVAKLAGLHDYFANPNPFCNQ